MAVSEAEVAERLRGITIPGTGQSLVDAGAVRSLAVDGETVRLALVLETVDPGLSKAVKGSVEQTVGALDGVATVEVEVETVLATAGPHPAPPETWADRIPGVRSVVAVASGKGGVGKSTVAANLALALADSDQQVGLLDADIYGPSQQLMTGTGDEPHGTPNGKIVPLSSAGGVKVMSLGFIVDADQPVIWRGPMLMKALEQLVGDVEWGELDYLVVDLPPGTGDVALTLCQNVPLAGAIIVTTPQDVALVDARKGLHMFRKLGVRVLGLVENMSHFVCPACGHVEHVFGEGGGRRTADSLGIPFLGAVPLDPAIVIGGDQGRPVVRERPDSPAARAFVALAERTIASTATPA